MFADLTIAAQLSPGNTGGLIAAVSASAQGQPAHADNCVTRPDYVGCVPYYPGFITFAVTTGLETRSGHFRFLGGPARLSEDGDAAVGVLGRVDTALPLFWHTSFTASLRGVLIPKFRGDSFRTGALSFGIRFR